MGIVLTRTQKSALPLGKAGIVSLTALLITGSMLSGALAVPTSVDPAKLEQRFDAPPSPLPTAPVENLAPANKQPVPKGVQAQLAKKRFVLKKVVIEGATLYKPEELAFAYKDQMGKEISLVDAQAIVARITALYREHDYILSQAIVPTQSITNGTLKIRVVEGYISNVVIQGDVKEGREHDLIASYGEHLKSKRPVKSVDLERYLLLMDDLPGATAKGLVRPSAKQFGAADMVVTMKRKMYEGSYTVDNRGSKPVGPWEHTGTLTANSLFGMYDRTLLRFVTTSPTTELRFFNVQHEEQVGTEGTRLILDLSHSTSKPGDSLKPAQIIGESDSAQLKAIHPFIRSRQENLSARGIFDFRNTDTDVFNNTNLTNDRTRVARIGGSYDFSDAWLGVNLIDAQISQGLNVFNASTKGNASSNPSTDGSFTKFNLDLARTQVLPRNFSLFTSATGQYASQQLLAAEQFSLGGNGFGQAYDPSELSGDHGLAGKVELRYGQTLGDPYLQSYQLYGFYDIGRVWLRNAGPGGNDKKSLASTGLGLRTNFSPALSGNLEVGLPLTKEVNNQGSHGDSARLFVSVTGRF